MNMPLVLLNRRRRGSVGYNPAGLFALNEPGIWLDPSDVANLDWRRNLLLWTEQFDNAIWSKISSTVSANADTDPIGQPTADQVTFTAGVSARVVQGFVVSGSLTYTLSFYVKGTAGQTLSPYAESSGGTYSYSQPSTVTLTGAWQRVEWQHNTAAGNTTVFLNIQSSASNTAKVVSVWGAQAELGSVATDYQRITDVNTEVLERFPRTTMYQDRAGSTAVTTPGQSVGLRLDKSKGLVLGSDEITNGDNEAALFSTATGPTATRGTLNRSTDLGGAAAKFNGTSSGPVYINPFGATSFSGSKAVYISFRVYIPSAWVGSGIRVVDTSDGSYLSTYTNTRDQWVSVSVFRPAKGSAWGLAIGDNVAGDRTGLSFYIDDLSIRELPGNHAVANSDAARGIYGIEPLGGRRNLLTFTEQFDNAAWAKTAGGVASAPVVTANAAAAPDGSMTADRVQFALNGGTTTADLSSLRQTVTAPVGQNLSFWARSNDSNSYVIRVSDSSGILTTITITPSWERFSLSAPVGGGAAIAYGLVLRGGQTPTNSNTADILIWGAQLETGSTATAYQRVVDQYNVTEAGKQTLHYVQYDGSDDGYVTPTITPGIDKVQVFAGVRKLSDAAVGVVIEHSASWVANVGSFILAAPGATSPNGDYSSASRGNFTLNANQGASTVVIAAPVTNVIAATHDIAGDFTTIRANGVQLGTATGDKGTGNFLAYPLYIGRRGGASLPFNGRDYGIITRFGANLDASTIAATESWLNQKTGAY